jgi:hypothetical protein
VPTSFKAQNGAAKPSQARDIFPPEGWGREGGLLSTTTRRPPHHDPRQRLSRLISWLTPSGRSSDRTNVDCMQVFIASLPIHRAMMPVAVALVLAVGSAGLAACGGSASTARSFVTQPRVLTRSSASTWASVEPKSERGLANGVEHTRAYRDLVAKIAACLRRNGVAVPATGADILHSGGTVNASDPQIRVAAGRCRRELLSPPSG